MKDRIPKYPGRVKLNPVPGQVNTFDLVRADEPTEPGTPLNKASLLSDSTAAALGLGSNATPDEAFVKLNGQVGDIKVTGRRDLNTNYLDCDGRQVAKSSYPALFDAIGPSYGGYVMLQQNNDVEIKRPVGYDAPWPSESPAYSDSTYIFGNTIISTAAARRYSDDGYVYSCFRYSLDNGLTWTERTKPVYTGSNMWTRLEKFDGKYIVSGGLIKGNGGILKSLDADAISIYIGNESSAYSNSFHSMRELNGKLFIAAVNHISYLSKGSDTIVELSFPFNGVVADSNLAYYKGYYYYQNTWKLHRVNETFRNPEPVLSNLPSLQISDVASCDNIIVAIASASGSVYACINGDTAQFLKVGECGNYESVVKFYKRGNVYWLFLKSKIYASTDGIKWGNITSNAVIVNGYSYDITSFRTTDGGEKLIKTILNGSTLKFQTINTFDFNTFSLPKDGSGTMKIKAK